MTKYRAYIHCRYYCCFSLFIQQPFVNSEPLKQSENQSDLYSEIHLNSSPWDTVFPLHHLTNFLVWNPHQVFNFEIPSLQKKNVSFPSPNFLSTEKRIYLPLRRDTLLKVVHMTSFRSRIHRKLSAVRVSGDSVHWSYTITSEYSSMSRWQVWLRRSPMWTWNQRSRLLYQLRMKTHFQ